MLILSGSSSLGEEMCQRSPCLFCELPYAISIFRSIFCVSVQQTACDVPLPDERSPSERSRVPPSPQHRLPLPSPSARRFGFDRPPLPHHLWRREPASISISVEKFGKRSISHSMQNCKYTSTGSQNIRSQILKKIKRRTTLILNLVQILVFGRHMAINMMILNTLIFALGMCGVRLSRTRVGDIVSGACSTTTGRHGAQPQLDEDNSLGVDSGCSCSAQGLEQQVRRTADVPRPDVRDSAPACAAASSSPPCKNNSTESAVDTAANPRRSANDHEEPALPKGGQIIPPSPAKTAHAWVIDTGATCHVTGDWELLRDLRPSVLSERLLMARGLHLPVVGTGSVQTDRITLSNVCYAPGLLVNLISVAQLCREHSLVTIFEPDVLYIKKTASAEIIGLASLDGSGRYVLDYLHLTGTSTGSHPHLDAEAEPCGIHSGHSSSQSTGTGTGTGQQAMPAYACSTKDEDQMPVALIAPSSTQAGGYPEVFIDSGASFRITGFGEALQNPEHKPMDIHASSSTQAGGDLVVVLDSGACFHMTGCGEVLQNREDMEEGSVVGISGTALPVTGQGSIMGTPVLPIWLDKVRYVQGLPRLIVSVSQLTRARSARVVFEPDCCRVERMSDNCTIGQGKRVGDLYTLDFLTHG